MGQPKTLLWVSSELVRELAQIQNQVEWLGQDFQFVFLRGPLGER